MLLVGLCTYSRQGVSAFENLSTFLQIYLSSPFILFLSSSNHDFMSNRSFVLPSMSPRVRRQNVSASEKYDLFEHLPIPYYEIEVDMLILMR